MSVPIRSAAAAGLVLVTLAPAPASEPQPVPAARGRPQLAGSMPVVREQRYRMVAAIRPLLFWTRASTVGGVRLVWRQGDGQRRGYELLLGSDPRRAPRKINRWGWWREESDETGAVMQGLMKQTSEESLDEAEIRLAREGQGGYVFKAIRTRVAQGEVRAESTTTLTARDYTYRDVDELWQLLESTTASPRVKSAPLPEGTRAGLLSAIVDIIHETVEVARPAGEGWRSPARRTVTFTFNAALYDLTLRSAAYVPTATYGGRRYDRLVRMDFESIKRATGARDRFTLVCGTEEPWAEVPVFVRYQPKWWLRTESILDEREQFERAPAETGRAQGN